jgi:hypothetical protein
MEIFNRDINPSDQFVEAYADLAFFARNPPIAEAFGRAERSAVLWKRLHVWVGRASLACVLLVMWTLAYTLTLAPLFGAPTWLEPLSAGLGVAGLGAQLILIFGRLKERWLLARFAAERLRCIKFQAFVLIAEEPDPAKATRYAELFTDQAIANLAQELMGGRSAMLEFNPSEIAIGEQPVKGHGNRGFIATAEAVYERLRLEVQMQHFEAQAHLSREADRLPATLSEVTFVLGAVIACLAIILTGRPDQPSSHGAVLAQAWLHFATWSLFATSAVVAVYQRGAARKSSADRYTRYARDIGRIRTRSPYGTPAGFAEAVRDMESVALLELDEFCRDAEQASYVF